MPPGLLQLPTRAAARAASSGPNSSAAATTSDWLMATPLKLDSPANLQQQQQQGQRLKKQQAHQQCTCKLMVEQGGGSHSWFSESRITSEAGSAGIDRPGASLIHQHSNPEAGRGCDYTGCDYTGCTGEHALTRLGGTQRGVPVSLPRPHMPHPEPCLAYLKATYGRSSPSPASGQPSTARCLRPGSCSSGWSCGRTARPDSPLRHRLVRRDSRHSSGRAASTCRAHMTHTQQT